MNVCVSKEEIAWTLVSEMKLHWSYDSGSNKQGTLLALITHSVPASLSIV